MTALLALLGSAPAGAADGTPAAGFQWGAGLDLVRDLPDAGLDPEHARYGFGPGLRGFARRWFAGDVALEVAMAASAAWGADRVEWLEQGGRVRYRSDDHWSMLTATTLLVGPELTVARPSPGAAYLGAAVGAAWVQNWHAFGGAATVLLDPEENDIGNDRNVDPFASAWAWAAGLHAGFHPAAGVLPGPADWEFEVGYTLAWLAEAALEGSPKDLDAVRAAFGLNAFRVGVAATFPVGYGAAR